MKKSSGVVKVTTSGQITLPKAYRDQCEGDLFYYEIRGGGFFVQPLKIDSDLGGKKFKLTDLSKFVFSSKDKAEKNLASKIDNALYGGD